VFTHWRVWTVNRCGDDIIDVDNGDDCDNINPHFAENQDPFAQSLGRFTVTIYVLV